VVSLALVCARAQFQKGTFTSDKTLTGKFQHPKKTADVRSEIANIRAAKDEAKK
jgi:hypothetical protein